MAVAQGGTMAGLLKISAILERILAFFARIGAWAGLVLVIVVVFDVISRKAGLNKEAVFGFNSTQFQESEFWLHTFLFALVMGYAYTRQAHVRIDLFRDRVPLRGKYLIEILGCALFLIPYSIIAFDLSIPYVVNSFNQGEVSKSVIGLSHIWVLKSALFFMYGLLGMAGVSQMFKAIAGFFGALPPDMISGTVGGDH